MTDEQIISQMPESFRRYFWDYDAASFPARISKETIIARLLEVGGWDAVQWLRQNVGDENVRSFLLKRKGRGISPRRLRFWSLILDLPSAKVDKWIDAAGRNPWSNRMIK